MNDDVFPRAWGVTRMKYASSLKGRLGWQGLSADEYREEGPYVVSSAHFRDERIAWELCPRVSTERYLLDSNIHLQPGDLLLMKDGAALGKLAFVEDLPGPACLNSHLLLFRPKQGAYWPKYLYYYCATKYFQEYITVRGTGATFLGVSQETIGNHPLRLPAIDVQQRVADFLDTKTAAIDALIEKQERLLALLAEKRQVVITQAVTKGLDPSVPMKDSGVDWIGRVPEHWDVAPLGARYDVQLGKMLDATRDDGDGEFPYLRNANIQWGKIDIDDIKRMSLSARDREKYRLVDGDLLVCEGGANINVVAKSAIWRGELAECYYQKALHRLRPRRASESPAFLLQSLWAAWAQGVFIAGANPNTVFHLTAVKLRAHRVPFPPAAEQLTIGAHLKAALARLDGVVARLRERADRLREYRQTLITAAVTGKLDISAREPEAARA
ncbi:MAG: restriction endonuclease subunit S [Myxococcales bacterium]|nr:restriction endonuclease subunit S [Myxococcales bacterium]MBK7197948.1 restriction endonuclease subunit S [Myxococcales bacterium]